MIFRSNFIKKIISYFFILDQKMLYIVVEPERYPADVSNLRIVENITFFFKNSEIKKFFKELVFLTFYNLIKILEIIYIPIIILFFFSKYRFVQINFTQVGIINEHLNFMIKKNAVNGYKSIVLIPKNSDFSFLKEIFSELIVIDNILLNLLLSPLKHSKFISCKANEIDNRLDRNLEIILKTEHTKIENQFRKKFQSTNLFKFKKSYENVEKNKINLLFSDLNFDKLIIFHHRQEFYKATSALRGSNINTYYDGLNYLLDKNYHIVRLIDNNSEKISFEKKNYYELNINENKNKQSQYYLIKNCQGFLGTSSGPVSITTLFDRPVLETNVFAQRVNVFNEKGNYILKKISKNGNILSFKELFELNFYKGIFLSRRKMEEYGFKVINNSSEEILKAVINFEKIISDKNFYPNQDQLNFKKSLPNYMELKFTKANIDREFIHLNKMLFEDLIKYAQK